MRVHVLLDYTNDRWYVIKWYLIEPPIISQNLVLKIGCNFDLKNVGVIQCGEHCWVTYMSTAEYFLDLNQTFKVISTVKAMHSSTLC